MTIWNFEDDGFVSLGAENEAADSYFKYCIENAIELDLPYLNKAMIGIMPDDFVLMVSRSGSGKTELLLTIARHFLMRGKSVALFALESHKHETLFRLRYKIMCSLAKENGDTRILNFNKWRFGKLDLSMYELGARRILGGQYQNFLVFERKDDIFGIDEFLPAFSKIRSRADVILVDHLHHFDLSDDEKENLQFKKIIRKMKSSAELLGRPVVCAAQVRKSSIIADKRILPSMEDVLGSSEIYKTVTHVVLFGNCHKIEDCNVSTDDPNLIPTIFCIDKNRKGGSVILNAGIMYYDCAANEYRNDLLLIGRLRKGNTKLEMLSKDDWPLWAK